MHRLRWVFLCFMIVLIGGISFSIAGQDSQDTEKADVEETEDTLCIPLGSFLLEPPESVEPKRSAVLFSHSKHFDFHCKECHHKWAGDAEIQGCSASGCHDAVKSPKKALKEGKYTEDAIKYYKYAFHESCISCHKKLKLQNQEAAKKMAFNDKQTTIVKTGPTGCVECHPKDE